MEQEIIKFGRRSGKYAEFSNFSMNTVTYQGITYTNSEAAWQAQKTLDMDTRREFAEYAPRVAKQKGRKLKLRQDWESVKYNLMVDVCYAKFSQNQPLKEKLLSTGDAYLIENTTGWHDNIWGNCDCEKCKTIEGKNLLGKALMEVRERLKKEE